MNITYNKYLIRPGVSLRRVALILVLTVGIAASEAPLFFGSIQYTIFSYSVLLFALSLAPLLWESETPVFQAFVLIPVFRLVNLTIPVFFELTLLWFPLVYGPLIPVFLYLGRRAFITHPESPRAINHTKTPVNSTETGITGEEENPDLTYNSLTDSTVSERDGAVESEAADSVTSEDSRDPWKNIRRSELSEDAWDWLGEDSGASEDTSPISPEGSPDPWKNIRQSELSEDAWDWSSSNIPDNSQDMIDNGTSIEPEDNEKRSTGLPEATPFIASSRVAPPDDSTDSSHRIKNVKSDTAVHNAVQESELSVPTYSNKDDKSALGSSKLPVSQNVSGSQNPETMGIGYELPWWLGGSRGGKLRWLLNRFNQLLTPPKRKLSRLGSIVYWLPRGLVVLLFPLVVIMFPVLVLGFSVYLAEFEYGLITPTPLISSLDLHQLSILAVVMIGFVGFVEELLFRGIIQKVLERRLGLVPGLLLASAIFGFMHSAYGVPMEIAFAGMVGVLFGVIYNITNSLVLVSVIHGTINVFLFGVIPLDGASAIDLLQDIIIQQSQRIGTRSTETFTAFDLMAVFNFF